MSLSGILHSASLIKKFRYLFFLFRKDMENYIDNSCLNDSNPECLATHIRLLSHALEKGMSLPNCRKGFGKQKISDLIRLCNNYDSIVNHKDHEAIDLAYSVIKAYICFQSKLGVDLTFIPKTVLEKVQDADSNAGILHLNESISSDLFKKVSEHRHSLRYYSNVPLKDEDIYKAISLAQSAPSACNRQPVRVYAVTNQTKITRIMSLHGGIRSFSTQTCIFIVTCDMTLYHGEYERNTAYVDGGIFTMNLLYALDSVGIASCPAIWGNIPGDDLALSNIANISSTHRIINLVVAGYYPAEEYRVAASTKRSLSAVLRIVK